MVNCGSWLEVRRGESQMEVEGDSGPDAGPMRARVRRKGEVPRFATWLSCAARVRQMSDKVNGTTPKYSVGLFAHPARASRLSQTEQWPNKDSRAHITITGHAARLSSPWETHVRGKGKTCAILATSRRSGTCLLGIVPSRGLLYFGLLLHAS